MARAQRNGSTSGSVVGTSRVGRPLALAFLLPLLGAITTSLGCDRDRKLGTGGATVGGTYRPDPKVDPKSSTPDQSPQETPKRKSETEKAKEPASGDAKRHAPLSKYAELTTTWKLGELQDLGPAGPTTATPSGVIFVTRGDELLHAAHTGAGEFQPVAAPREAFAKYGRGPSVSRTHAYWISERGALLRAHLKTKKVEKLFDKARMGTRTSVQTVLGRDVVLFIAQVDGNPMAYSWISAKASKPETLQVSPDGSTASSVTLVAGEPHPRAVILEGRTSMSPVHVRRLRVTKRRVTLEPDEVVWVGPPSHVLTEIHAISQPGDRCAAFIPTAKDFHDFGLAQLEISSDGGECPEPNWRVYPNGLDPAPLATGRLCGREHFAFARPSEERPRSPQELHLAPLVGNTPGAGEVIARSRAFNDVSLASTKNGAIVSWTADKRTWAMSLGCPD